MSGMLLMISVISADEARDALLGGAEILDIKNPAEGSLGAQSPQIIKEIKNLASGKVKISAAIGDLPNLPGTAALAAFGAAVCGADYVKAGLFGLRHETEAIALMGTVKNALRQVECSIIAAGYADFSRAGALNPDCLPRVAASAGVQGCLLDTAIKDGHNIFDFITLMELRRLIEEAHTSGLLFGVAGALKEQDLPLLRDIGADVVGLRTMVCRNKQRTEPLDSAAVRRVINRIL
jgi:(5-formylfuran-3-yl)methyl phosphate synthase